MLNSILEVGNLPLCDVTDPSRYVLAVSIENGCILLLKTHDDVSPIRINTGLSPLLLEWSNCRQLLTVAGTSHSTRSNNTVQEYTNVVRMYTDTGMLLYSSLIPYTQVRNITSLILVWSWTSRV